MDNEVKENNKPEEIKQNDNKKNKNKVLKIISRILGGILLIIIVFEVAIGIIDMNSIGQNKEPLWHLGSSYEEVDGRKETTYNLGLYVIKKVEENSEVRISLKPFFLR